MTQPTDQSPAPVDATVDLLAHAAELVEEFGREDLGQRIRRARDDAARPPVLVCVVGEFKKGKSSLINAILGQAICPVDDDLATAVITVVYHRDEPQVSVRRRDGGHVVVETVATDRIAELVSEQGNVDNVRRLERVDIGFPHPVLGAGIALVDTPGAGALSPAATAATLAFLPHADALLFVTDASAELTGPEADFLRRAADTCDTIVCCLTKTDLYPEWRRIVEIDAGHTRDLGVQAPVIPLSSALRALALEREDRALNDASGFPRLLRLLELDVLDRNRRRAARDALAGLTPALAPLRGAYETELGVVRDAVDGESAIASLDHARARLEHLQGPGARWSVMLNDQIADVSNAVGHRFRGALRLINRSMEESVEKLKSPRDWEVLTGRLQFQVAEVVTDVFAHLAARLNRIRDEVVELLQEEHLELPGFTISRQPDVRAMWTERPIEAAGGSKVGRGVGQGWTAVRGGAGGLITFGILSQFLPAAGAALLVSTPVTLGLGVAFGTAQAVQQRRSKVAARRQQARVAVRQFLDDVQFEVGNGLTEMLRDAQRELRDGFGERVTELHRTYVDAVRDAQADVQRSETAKQGQAVELERRVALLDGVLTRADELERAL